MAKKKAKAGDVIFVDRGLFRHFGVYVGHDRVIHYAPPKGEFKFDADEACIHEASMEEFLDGDETYYVCDFSEDDHRDDEDDSWWDIFRSALEAIVGEEEPKEQFHLYTPQSTIARARRRIGEKSYDLLENNCEHFALWCKTGISESRQVDGLMDCISTVKLVAKLLD
ncbi:lecithin retinol acyltransferase family protein [uncultured Megasphaera sp.]|uniref:lecithin retinol acyltransferase family protein n=1 Tax=uncultured Megasphaera sp. TaxID=165188 RepID=UPI00345B8A23